MLLFIIRALFTVCDVTMNTLLVLRMHDLKLVWQVRLNFLLFVCI